MIDIRLIRENPDLVKENLKKRLQDDKQVELLLNLDTDWRNVKKQVDELRAKHNQVNKKINEAKKKNMSVLALLGEAKDIPKKIEEKEGQLKFFDKERIELWKKIPNFIDKSVPVGDEKKNKVLKKYGEVTKKKIKDGHAEILEGLGLIDTKKAGEVSGSRFYYLKKELVRLNYALISFALDFLGQYSSYPPKIYTSTPRVVCSSSMTY